MRCLLAAVLSVGLVAPAFADDKKKDETEKKDEEVKCLIVKAADKDVNPPVVVDYTSKFKAKTKVAMTPAVAKTLCQSESNKPASEWIRDNGACETAKKTFKYTVTFGVAGKEEKFEKNVICAKKK